MIFTLIFLLIALAGFGYSAYLDLRYTEFPDWLPYSIIIAAIIARVAYYISVSGFTVSAVYSMAPMFITGILFLGFGLLFYYTNQWGDGDAWLLGGMGFLFPDSAQIFVFTGPLPFQLVLIFNFFIVSLVYMIVYSAYLGITKKDVNKEFRKLIGEKKKRTLNLIAGIFALASVLAAIMIFYRGINPGLSLFIFPFFLSAMVVFFQYGKAIESKAFRKKVDVKELQEGDVVMDGKWVGLTKDDIEKYKKRGGKVWIKEGVRFAPVFLITILATLFMGNLMLFFIF